MAKRIRPERARQESWPAKKLTIAELWLSWVQSGITPFSVIEELQYSGNIKTSQSARAVVQLIREQQTRRPPLRRLESETC